MTVMQYKKYKIKTDEFGKNYKIYVDKKYYNKKTKNGTATWYFSDRYIINEKTKQYVSQSYELKRQAEEEERLFLINPIEYIKKRSKLAKNHIEAIDYNKNNNNYLNVIFEEFLQYKNKYSKETTIYEYNLIWNKFFKENLGKKTIKEINLKETNSIHEKINTLKNENNGKSLSISRKNNLHTLLVDFYDFLLKRGLIEINYAKIVGSFRDVKINKNEKKKIKYQTLDEFNDFMCIVDDEFWYTFFNFAFWHGCRLGEQRALKINDIDLEHDIVTFNKTFSRSISGGEIIGSIKNNKERKIFLSEQSKPYIEKLINFYKKLDGYSDDWFLFGGPINTYKNRVQRALKKYYDILKETSGKEINVLSHHEFGRHSHASFLLNVGADREDIYTIIAERLGDTVDVIRETYAKPYTNLNINKSKMLLDEENIKEKLKEM